MADEPITQAVQLRKELDQHYVGMQDISTVLHNTTKPDDPKPLSMHQLQTLIQQLDSTKTKISDAIIKLAGIEMDEDALAEDQRTRSRLNLKWEQLNSLLMDISTAGQAERLATSLRRSINRLEKLQLENPTRNYKDGISTLNPHMNSFREALDGANLPERHALWNTYEEYEERIFTMLAAEPAPPDVKTGGKLHDKGSYKVSALAIPKFDGKIQGWVPFWQEFDYAIHKKVDMVDAVKMVYLKQAVTDPGLNTTISDLGIEEGSYAAAIKLLHDRYDKPRVMHRLFCENLRDLKSNLNPKASVSEMADSAQHILLGFTRLKKLGISEAITSLVESAMGPELREQWLNYTSTCKDTPPAEKVIEFLRMRADREDSVTVSRSQKSYHEKPKPNKPQKKNKGIVAASPVASSPTGAPVVATPSAGPSVVSTTGAYNSQSRKEYPPCKYACPLCPEKHYCYHCNLFKAYTPKQRKDHVTTHNLCMNCLKPGHTAEQCRSLYKCSVCKAKHNSLLHDDTAALSSPALGLASASAIIPDGLLMTANVLVTGTNGVTRTARAFIDGGSSVTLISNKLKTALALKPTGQNMSIDGVAGFVGETQHPVVNLTLSSPRDQTWERNITAISMPKVIRDLPLKDASITTNMPHLQNLVLADPLYHRVGPIDMLLGLDVFPHIFKSGREEGPPNTPVAWDTVFGWTVLGMYNDKGCAQAVSASTLIVDPIQAQDTSDQMLFQLWKVEEPQRPEKAMFSTEEQRVEDHFDLTHEYLEEEKRYRVALPKTLGDMTLGESRGSGPRLMRSL